MNKDTKQLSKFTGHKSPILCIKLDPLSEFLVKIFLYLLFIGTTVLAIYLMHKEMLLYICISC